MSPVDYDNVVANLTFVGSASETQTFTVATLDDALLEGTETFTVSINATDPLVVDSDTATGTITDNDTGGVCSVPSTLLFDDFETGGIGLWDGSVTSTPGDFIGVTTDQPFAGTYGLRADIDTLADPSAKVWKNFAGQTTLYARIQIYLPPGFVPADWVTVMEFIDDSWQNILGVSINDDMTLYMFNSLGGEFYGHAVGLTISTGAWHTLEMMATMATSAGANDGEVRLWLDGILDIEEIGINLYDTGVNDIDRFSTGIYWAGLNDANTVYIDDVTLCTEAMSSPGTTTLYRSVGITATDLNISPRTVTISGTTATFSGTMPNGIGVGDVLTYNSGGNQLAFITGRTSDTVYTVADKDGATPTSASAGTAVGVYRAYTSLFNWEASSENLNITEPVENDVNPSTDLVSSNTVMMVSAYGDGTDTTGVTIDSWTTGTNNYIQIYTPVSSSEVGTSQRHSGVWDTSKYYIESGGRVLDIQEAYVRIEGLQIRQTSVSQIDDSGILVLAGSATSELYISHNIIRGVTSTFWHTGIEISTVGPSSVAYIWNNIIYDFGDPGQGHALNLTDPDLTSYIYNNTLYNNGSGILEDTGTGVAIGKNNIAFNNADDYDGMDAASDNNLGEDAAFAGDGNYVQTSQTAAQMFVDPTGSPRDLHILSTSDAYNVGADLSGDGNLPFSDDIDLDTRSGSWDIGADENAPPGPAGNVNYRSIGTNAAILYSFGNVSINSGTSTATFGGSATLPNDIGIGDELRIGATTFFILSRDSDTQVTVQETASSTLTNQTYEIYRAYTSPQAWEDARQGNLVSEDRREVGVLYADGTFTGPATEILTVLGSTTDATHYMEVIIGPGQQHDGTGGALGTDVVVFDGADTTKHGVRIYDHFTRVQGLELKRFRSDNGSAGVHINDSITNVLLEDLLIHDFDHGTFSVTGVYGNNNSSFTVRNCIVYDGDTAGIRGQPGTIGTIENCTIHGMASRGVFEDTGTFTVTNTIAMNSGTDFDMVNGTQSNTLSSDGTGTIINKLDTDQFVSVTPGSEDFHLKSGADAIDVGTDLSGSFTNDIDGDTRPIGAAWDIGADETASGLVAHWTFDEGSGQTAADSAGTNDGTLGSSAGVDANDPTWACVVGGNALSFDGDDDYVDAGSASTLDDLGPMTVSAWIKPSTVAGEFYSTFVAKSDGGTTKWLIEIDNSSPEVNVFEFNIDYATTNLQRSTSNNTVSYDVWQHVAVTWDGSASAANVHIYKDGAELTYQTTQDGVGTRDSDAALPLIIGFVTEIAPPLPGLIDDVRIYNRALSTDEISALAASAPTDCASEVVLLVVPDAASLGAQDLDKKALIETWGYTVVPISANDTQANFDAAVATSDAVYISEEISSGDLGTKLRNATIGVVIDETALTDEFGISSATAGYTSTDIDVTDNSHYITSSFSTGPLTIASPGQELHTVSGTIAAGAQVLAEEPATTNGTLVVIEVGGALYDSGVAAGRRVYLPWGGGTFDINSLNANGQLLMRKAIEWAILPGTPASPAWWDSNYANRAQITVSAGSSAIPADYPTRFQFDHAGLVTLTKSVAGGNDARIVYWNGATNTELDRTLFDDGPAGAASSTWNSATTTLMFKTAASIAASGTDTGYYLYYGYPSAGAPPTNTPSSRFYVAEDLTETLTSSTTYSQKLALTFTPSDTTEHWVVVATWRQKQDGALGSNSDFGRGRLQLNGVTRTGNSDISHRMSGEIWKVLSVVLKITGTATSQTVSIDFRADGGTDGIDNARILAFMIPDPGNADIQYAEDLSAVIDNVNPTTAQALSFTPSSNGNYVWMASGFFHEAPGGNTNGGMFLQDEGGTDQQFSGESHFANNDAEVVPITHFEERSLLTGGSRTFTFRHEPDDTADPNDGGERMGLTQLLFRSDVFEGVESAGELGTDTTSSTSYVEKLTLNTASQASNRDYIYLAVGRHDDSGGDDLNNGHYVEVRMDTVQQVEDSHFSDRSGYPSQIVLAFAEYSTGNHTFDIRHRTNSGLAVSELGSSQILALRYKEPGTSLGSEE